MLDSHIWINRLPLGMMIWLPNLTPEPLENFSKLGPNSKAEIPIFQEKATQASMFLLLSTSTYLLNEGFIQQEHKILLNST